MPGVTCQKYDNCQPTTVADLAAQFLCSAIFLKISKLSQTLTEKNQALYVKQAFNQMLIKVYLHHSNYRTEIGEFENLPQHETEEKQLNEN